MESETMVFDTSRRRPFLTLWHSIATFGGLMMRQRSGGGELNASWYSSFFCGRIEIFGCYNREAVVVRRCNVDCNVNCDRLRRPCSSPNVILEDTRNIYTRGLQLSKQKEI